MKRTLAITFLLWMFVWAGAAVLGVSNNPNNPNALTMQGGDPTGNAGYPIAVVGAPGADPFNVNVVGGGGATVTANQGTPNAGGALAWPVTIQPTIFLQDNFSNPASAVGPIASFGMTWDAASNKWNRSTNTVNQGTNPWTITGNVTDFQGTNPWTITGNVIAYQGAGPWQMQGADAVGDAVGILTSRPFNQAAIDTFKGVVAYQEYNPIPTVYHTVSTMANGNTALWTPAAGKKFRLQRYLIEIPDNAIGGPGVLTISLFDGAAGATGQIHDVFLPGLALNTNGVLYNSGWIDLGAGFVSTAANNTLNVNLNAATGGAGVRVICAGKEE